MRSKAAMAIGIGVLVIVGVLMLNEHPETVEVVDPTGLVEMNRRFEEVDRQIDSFLPKDRGIQARPAKPAHDADFLTVVLTRLDADDPRRAHTLITVDGGARFELPQGDCDDTDPLGVEQRLAEYDEVFEHVKHAIAEAWRRRGKDPEPKGRIQTPRPEGRKVPKGDVIRVLDTFIQLGITDVAYEGAPAPLPRSAGSVPEPDER